MSQPCPSNDLSVPMFANISTDGHYSSKGRVCSGRKANCSSISYNLSTEFTWKTLATTLFRKILIFGMEMYIPPALWGCHATAFNLKYSKKPMNTIASHCHNQFMRDHQTYPRATPGFSALLTIYMQTLFNLVVINDRKSNFIVKNPFASHARPLKPDPFN